MKTKWIRIAPLLLLLIAAVLSGFKWGMAAVLLLTWGMILGTVVYALRRKAGNPLLEQACGLLLAVCVCRTLLYNYAEPGFRFWLIPTFAAGVVGVTALLLRRAGKLPLRLGTVVLAFLLTWVCCWATLHHLNSLLDRKEPQVYQGTVVAKEQDHRPRRADHYTVTLVREGKEQKLLVSSTSFARLREGDTLTYYLYEGAFGQPYYYLNGTK